ncbi:hypothetical protein [Nitrospirillum viridazoti]|uniref:Uncharacterized protein n=1 Tax=Nitrospirillum viridazoti CBAmc TaxID=1441467 RepID=A0A248JRP6_9PROT|nr:hypothetical protein [Nitrospirillum amazonense]ASG21423.1 hypothetical protein Y958_11725 [Nitrospirillum amazonense CBAmc]TWB29338.1 hypothetical protein FBZ91_1265 [Nitrospirillum amazonense]
MTAVDTGAYALVTGCRLRPERSKGGTFLITDTITGKALEMDHATFLSLATDMMTMATETHHPER